MGRYLSWHNCSETSIVNYCLCHYSIYNCVGRENHYKILSLCFVLWKFTHARPCCCGSFSQSNLDNDKNPADISWLIVSVNLLGRQTNSMLDICVHIKLLLQKKNLVFDDVHALRRCERKCHHSYFKDFCRVASLIKCACFLERVKG